MLDVRTAKAYITYMTSHQKLISARGGIRPLARSLGHKNHTTVQGWWERGSIPESHLPIVMAVPVVSIAA